jgi:dienelactone hydrolase
MITLSSHLELLSPHFKVLRPGGSGRAPAIVMLHGCGGPRPFIDDMARLAASAGAGAIVVDSFKPRGIGRMAALATVCTGARLQGRERAGDLFAALAWARARDWIDPARLGAIGWSHGGWTILDALSLHAGSELSRATGLSELPAEPLEGLTAAMAVYPYAGIGSMVGQRRWRVNPRTTAIVAEHDYIVGATRGALERQRTRGATLDIVLFGNATHAFEDAEAGDPRVRFNPAALAREHEMLRAMIARL